MVQTTPSSSSNIQAEIQGEISGQVVVGNHNVQIHAEHGALVNVISGGELPVPHARQTPILSLRPRPFRGLVDRKPEIEAVTSALLSEAPVEIHGEPGIGKTSLLRHLSHQPEFDRFSAGVVYKSARTEAPADLLQFLFDAFYECTVPFKPTDTQVRHFLEDKKALVILDDIDLNREAFEGLMDAVPSFAFVAAANERRLWGEVKSIALGGLPADDALALVERELGRPLTSEERETAANLCAALGGNPLRILQEVAAAREERRPLLAPSQPAHAATAADKPTAPTLASLSKSQRSVLGVLAAFGGASVGVEHLAALSELTDAEPVVQTLEERNLVQGEGSRRRLTGNLVTALSEAWDLTEWREIALVYFISWAEQNRNSPDRLLEEVDCLRELLNWAGATGRWKEAQRLGRAMEGALTVSGRWEAWRSVIQSVLQASRALGDEASTGWAFHQLGTRALCLADQSDARTYLKEALDIRESLGDRLGAAVTRHNLNILLGPPAPADDSGSSASNSGSSVQAPLLLKVAGAALLVGLGGFGLWKLVGGESLLPPTGLSVVASSASEVDLSWVDKSEDETEFRIERKKGDGVFTEVSRAPANSSTFKDGSLEPNTSYTYRVRAAGPRGESGYSNETGVLSGPAVPSDLSLREVPPSHIELSWKDRNPNPSAFKIERSSDSGASFSSLSTTAVGITAYSDTLTDADSTLYYRVRATNASGDSGYSNLAVWSASPRAPVAPRLIVARGASSTQVDLRWTDGSDNEIGFKIERRAGEGSYAQIAVLDANATSYEDRGLSPDTSYRYRMRATNAAGDSPYSNEMGATTLLESPQAPGDLAGNGSSAGASLSWRDNSNNETGFHIERRIGGDSYQRIKTMAAGSVRFVDSGLHAQTSYTYRVQAFNRAGGSAFSNEVSITTEALPGKIEVAPSRVRFDPVTVGSSATAEVRITNAGRGPLNGSVEMRGASFKLLLQQQNFSLTPSQTLPVKVEFAPAESSDFAGILTIKSSDPQRPEVRVALIGSGTREPATVALVSLSLGAAEVVGGESSDGKVTLNGPAQAGGADVSLSSNSAAAGVPRSVVVNSGETSAVFTIKTNRVARNTRSLISASLGTVRRTQVLTVRAAREPQQPEVKLASLILAPTVVTGGQPSEGKVTLSGAAPADGAVIALSSNNQVVTVPRTVSVKGGQTGAAFTIRTNRVARSTRATISASLGTERQNEVLEVRAEREPQQPEVKLSSLSLVPRVVTGGESSQGSVRLDGNAPEGGAVIALTSNNQVVDVPGTVVVRAGQRGAGFTIKTQRVGRNTRATVSAALGGERKSDLLEVRAATEPTQPEVKLQSLTLRPGRVRGGQRSTGTIKLSGNAPRDLEVALSSNNPRVATVQRRATVRQGSSVATFVITTVARAGPGGGMGGSAVMGLRQSRQVEVTITASLDGRSLTESLTVSY